MKLYKHTIQQYVFERDGEHCFHCGKPLRLGKMTLDHYNPRSHGGTDDYFNLVACCKNCNQYKKSDVPDDWIAVNTALLLMGIADGKINFAHDLRMSSDEIEKQLHLTKQITHSRAGVQFEGTGFRILIRNNQIIKWVRFNERDER